VANFTKGPWIAERQKSFSYAIHTNYVHDRGHDCNVVREVRCEANALLIAAAPDMFVALAKLVCPECGHELQHHADRYGCEIERGDREGNEGEPAQAMGPCGCNDADLREAYPDLVRATEAIRKAKGEADRG
jgi:hypothetical protein